MTSIVVATATFEDTQLVARIMEKEMPPALVGWNRLEGRPRRHEFDRSLRAEVRDPLWFLTRQWQLGEFIANDAGTPAMARVEIQTSRLDLFAPRNGVVSAIDESAPLEAVVEREAVPLDLNLRVRIGQQWLTLLSLAGLTRSYRADYRTQYRINLPTRDEANAAVHAHEKSAQWYAAAAERAVDGGALLVHLRGGGAATNGVVGVAALDIPKIDQAAVDLLAWFAELYFEPEAATGPAWVPSALEYQFRTSAPGTAGTSQLVAEEYKEGHLDWYNFDWDKPANTLVRPPSLPAPAVPTSTTLEFIPAPIAFGGIPNERWWEFEDRRVDFGNIDASTTDLAKLLLIEFGLVYSNDWFILPYPMDVGSLAAVQGVSVTNVFGESFWIGAAGQGSDDDWQRWSLYNLSVASTDTSAARTELLFPNTAAKPHEGEPLEVVHLVRDEMANMVWGVESRVPLPHGFSAPGAETARETLAYAESLYPVPPAPPATASVAKITYRVSTEVPEHFIPFVPVHVPGSNRQVQLQRGSMLRVLERIPAPLPPAPPHPRVEPQTSLLRAGLASGTPYFIHEEEVPRAGRMVTRSFQRARWQNGKVVLWLGRQSRTGRGEASSGLAYDRISPVEEP